MHSKTHRLLLLLPFVLFLPSCGGPTMTSFWVEPRRTTVACCQTNTIQFRSFAEYSDGRREELTLLSEWRVLTPNSNADATEATVDGKGLVTIHDFCARTSVWVFAEYGPADRFYMVPLNFDQLNSC